MARINYPLSWDWALILRARKPEWPWLSKTKQWTHEEYVKKTLLSSFTYLSPINYWPAYKIQKVPKKKKHNVWLHQRWRNYLNNKNISFIITTYRWKWSSKYATNDHQNPWLDKDTEAGYWIQLINKIKGTRTQIYPACVHDCGIIVSSIYV